MVSASPKMRPACAQVTGPLANAVGIHGGGVCVGCSRTLHNRPVFIYIDRNALR